MNFIFQLICDFSKGNGRLNNGKNVALYSFERFPTDSGPTKLIKDEKHHPIGKKKICVFIF